jgi:hypothetical protein
MSGNKNKIMRQDLIFLTLIRSNSKTWTRIVVSSFVGFNSQRALKVGGL